MTNCPRATRYVCAAGLARLLGCALSLGLAAGCAPARNPPAAVGHRPITRIVFVGDSLVHRSAADHLMLAAIGDDLARRHPSRTFDIVDAGVNGNRVADIRDRFDHDVASLQPAAVVFFFDSDVSDVDDVRLPEPERQSVREAYERDLRDVLHRAMATGAHVLLSGPALIGERPRGRNPKDPQLDAYRRINRRVATSVSVAYVDMRRPFFAGRPPGTPADVDRGLLTEDGEHLNDRGARIAAGRFVTALDAWLRSVPAQQ